MPENKKTKTLVIIFLLIIVVISSLLLFKLYQAQSVKTGTKSVVPVTFN